MLFFILYHNFFDMYIAFGSHINHICLFDCLFVCLFKQCEENEKETTSSSMNACTRNVKWWLISSAFKSPHSLHINPLCECIIILLTVAPVWFVHDTWKKVQANINVDAHKTSQPILYAQWLNKWKNLRIHTQRTHK